MAAGIGQHAYPIQSELTFGGRKYLNNAYQLQILTFKLLAIPAAPLSLIWFQLRSKFSRLSLDAKGVDMKIVKELDWSSEYDLMSYLAS